MRHGSRIVSLFSFEIDGSGCEERGSGFEERATEVRHRIRLLNLTHALCCIEGSRCRQENYEEIPRKQVVKTPGVSAMPGIER